MKKKIQILKNTIGALPLEHRDARNLTEQIKDIEASALDFVKESISGVVGFSTQKRIIEKARRLLDD